MTEKSQLLEIFLISLAITTIINNNNIISNNNLLKDIWLKYSVKNYYKILR